MNGNDNIKAYRYDMTVPKFRTEGAARVPDGTEKKTCFHAVGYEKDEVDYGEYLNHCGGGGFQLCDENGDYILDDECQIADLFEIRKPDAAVDVLKNVLKNPFDWFEIRYGEKKDCTLRVTALPERPRVCAEKCDTGDVSYEGLRRIRIYGKPIQEDGILTTKNRLWISDLNDRVLESIRDKAGRIDGVEIVFNNGSGFQIDCDDDSMSIFLKIVAPNMDVLKTVLTNLGAKEIKESLIDVNLKTGNSIDGSERIYADIVISQKSY